MRHKFNHDINLIRTRAMSGEIVLFESLPQNITDRFSVSSPCDEAAIIAIPGTLDPPHFAHLELLLDALVHESGLNRGKRVAYGLFLSPVGEEALGPTGEPWKAGKTSFAFRSEMCHKATNLLYPLTQTSRIGSAYPGDFGTRNAIRILKSFGKKTHFKKTRFVVAAGSDTYRKWGKHLTQVINEDKKLYPNTIFKILVRDCWQNPLENEIRKALPRQVELLQGIYSLPIRSTAVRHGSLNLIPRAVREYIHKNKIYPPSH